MAQAGKGKLNYRCPSCFMRDIDMDMFYAVYGMGYQWTGGEAK